MEYRDRRNTEITPHLVTIFFCYVVVDIEFMDNSVVR